MKRFLRLLALLLAFGVTALWLGAGANRGWTKTSQTKKTLDEVTGLEGITYEQRFLPGLDVLGAAWILAGGLAGVSFVIRRNSARNTQN